jgi:L-alanine-DL-glutamate epimerase-like enolase superfamily enzyme
MRVEKFETWICRRPKGLFDEEREGAAPMPWSYGVGRITTSDGIEGIATFWAARSGAITDAYLSDVIAPVILGHSIHDREKIWHDFWNIDRHGAFFPVFLPGPIDVALWDAAARTAGLPLHRYLGSYRTSMPVYASSLWLPAIDDYVREALHYKERGFKAYKVHPCGPSSMDMAIHAAVREAVGPDMILMTDPVAEYTLPEAIRVARHLEQLGYYWFEEPFRDYELDKYAKLAAAVDIPIVGTETTRGGPWGVAQAIKADALDMVRADVSWKGGITGTLKVCHLAEAHGINCELHTTTMGPMDVANLHVACAVRNSEYFELFVPEDTFQLPMKQSLRDLMDADGNIHVPEGPGLGIDIDWDVVDDNCISHRVFDAGKTAGA